MLPSLAHVVLPERKWSAQQRYKCVFRWSMICRLCLYALLSSSGPLLIVFCSNNHLAAVTWYCKLQHTWAQTCVHMILHRPLFDCFCKPPLHKNHARQETSLSSPSMGLGRRFAKPRRQAIEIAACSFGSSTCAADARKYHCVHLLKTLHDFPVSLKESHEHDVAQQSIGAAGCQQACSPLEYAAHHLCIFYRAASQPVTQCIITIANQA